MHENGVQGGLPTNNHGFLDLRSSSALFLFCFIVKSHGSPSNGSATDRSNDHPGFKPCFAALFATLGEAAADFGVTLGVVFGEAFAGVAFAGVAFAGVAPLSLSLSLSMAALKAKLCNGGKDLRGCHACPHCCYCHDLPKVAMSR